MTRVIQDLQVPLVDRKERRESWERRAKGANQAKTVIQVLQGSLDPKENQASQVLQAETAREDSKATVDSQVLQEW